MRLISPGRRQHSPRRPRLYRQRRCRCDTCITYHTCTHQTLQTLPARPASRSQYTVRRVSILCPRPSSLTSTATHIRHRYLPPTYPTHTTYQVRRLSQTTVPSVSPLGTALGSVLASAFGATPADKESASAGTADNLTLPKALAPSVFRVGGKDSSRDGGSVSILRALRDSRDGKDGKDGGSHGKRFGPFAGFDPSTIFGTPLTSLTSLHEDEAALETQADDAEAMCRICARGCTACTCTCSEDDSDTPEWIKEGERDVGLVFNSSAGEGGGKGNIGDVGGGGMGGGEVEGKGVGEGDGEGEELSTECITPRRRSTSPNVLDSWAGREAATQAMGPTRRKRTVSFDLGASAVRGSNAGPLQADCRPSSSSELSSISKSCLAPPMRHPRYSPASTSVPAVPASSEFILADGPPAISAATVTTATASSYTVPPPPPEVIGAPVEEKMAAEETALEELEAEKTPVPQQEPEPPPPPPPPPPLPQLQQQLQQAQKEQSPDTRSWSVGFDFSLRPPPPPAPQLRPPPPQQQQQQQQLPRLPPPPPPPPLPPPQSKFDERRWEARAVDPSPTLARGWARLREITLAPARRSSRSPPCKITCVRPSLAPNRLPHRQNQSLSGFGRRG